MHGDLSEASGATFRSRPRDLGTCSYGHPTARAVSGSLLTVLPQKGPLSIRSSWQRHLPPVCPPACRCRRRASAQAHREGVHDVGGTARGSGRYASCCVRRCCSRRCLLHIDRRCSGCCRPGRSATAGAMRWPHAAFTPGVHGLKSLRECEGSSWHSPPMHWSCSGG